MPSAFLRDHVCLMKISDDYPSGAQRTVKGLLTGAVWGLPCGLLFGLWRTFRSDYPWPWYLDMAGSCVVFIVGAALVGAIGKGIADSFDGAMQGAIVGGIFGIVASVWTTGLWVDAFGDLSQVRFLLLGLASGAFPCALIGATAGALIQRRKRNTRRPRSNAR